MINVFDVTFNLCKVKNDDLFICSVGYEERSYYLLNQFRSRVLSKNILVFSFDELVAKTKKKNRILDAQLNELLLIPSLYRDTQSFISKVSEFVSSKIEHDKVINVYIDYSYMPRMWYCKLPSLQMNYNKSINIIFLYTEGIYPLEYYDYPTAGIGSLVPFSGMPSLRTHLKRTHIVSLSYDVIRTEGLLSMLDPESIITCNAYDPDDRKVYENILEINESILSRADYSLTFHLDNFSFIVAKICEVINENLPLGDVVLIPDGPKPLIFALSLSAKLLEEKKGLTCMQILRSNCEDPVVEVHPKEKVLAFSIRF